jgi:hypothetical protein
MKELFSLIITSFFAFFKNSFIEGSLTGVGKFGG